MVRHATASFAERGGERYGFLVDHVDRIMSISGSQRFTALQITRTGTHDGLRGDMDEMIDIGTEAQRRPLFRCDHLLERLGSALPQAASRRATCRAAGAP